jgi:hypothetical protein
MSADELRLGQTAAYETFDALSSMSRRFPVRGDRRRLQWFRWCPSTSTAERSAMVLYGVARRP